MDGWVTTADGDCEKKEPCTDIKKSSGYVTTADGFCVLDSCTDTYPVAIKKNCGRCCTNDSPGCLGCDSSGGCINCAQGYVLTEKGACELDSDSNSDSDDSDSGSDSGGAGATAAVVVILLLIAGAIGAIYFYRKRKGPANNDAAPEEAPPAAGHNNEPDHSGVAETVVGAAAISGAADANGGQAYEEPPSAPEVKGIRPTDPAPEAEVTEGTSNADADPRADARAVGVQGETAVAPPSQAPPSPPLTDGDGYLQVDTTAAPAGSDEAASAAEAPAIGDNALAPLAAPPAVAKDASADVAEQAVETDSTHSAPVVVNAAAITSTQEDDELPELDPGVDAVFDQALSDDGPVGKLELPGIAKKLGLSPTQHKEYTELWDSSQIVDGALEATAAVPFLGKSELPKSDLKKIWKLADTSTPKGRLTKDEFFVACKLVAQRQAGSEITVDHLGAPTPMPRFGPPDESNA